MKDVVMRNWVRTTVAGVFMVFFSLASIAPAAYDPLGSGTTKLIIDKHFSSFLRENGVRLSTAGGAKKKGLAVFLPVSGGDIDPTLGKGEIQQKGSIAFASDRKRVPLRELTVKTKHSPLIAKVGGSQLKVATAGRISSARAGFGTAFSARGLKLSAKVATRLNKKLRPRIPFSAGQPLGSLVSNAQPRLASVVEANRATLVFDPAFVAKLDAHFVSLNPIFPAEHEGPTFTLPIVAGGNVAPDGSGGTLRTGGSVELLQLHGGQVFWKELWLDFGARYATAELDVEPTPAFPGVLGRIGVFDFALPSPSPDPRARTVSVAAAPLALQAQGAAGLNEAFAERKEDFRAGEMVGALSFVAQTQ